MLAPTAIALWALCANPYLDEGKRLFDALKYDRAEEELELATQVPTSTVDERRLAFDLLARSRAARGHLDGCEQAYRELLVADPYAPAPADAAPKIAAAFTRAKLSLYPKDSASLRVLPSAPGRLEVEVVDPWSVAQSIWLLEKKNGQYTSSALQLAGHRASAELEPSTAERDYYVEARGEGGARVASLGSAAEPLVVEPVKVNAALAMAAPPPVVVEKRAGWRPLALAGAAAVMLAAGAALAVSSSADAQSAGSATWASDIDRFDRSAHDKALAANVLVGGSVLAGAGAVVLAVSF